MRQFLCLLFLLAAIGSSIGQGLVNFYNTPGTLVSLATSQGNIPISGPVGSYYFTLLIGGTGISDPRLFAPTGIYATNLATPGLFSGGSAVSVPAWAAGSTRNYLVAGWSAASGHDFQPSWLFSKPPPIFGISPLGTGVAGGNNGMNLFPNWNIFGPGSLDTGFDLLVPVPEPAVGPLLVCGFTLLWLRRRTN